MLEREDLPAKARQLGGYLKSKLNELSERFEIIGDVRGRGLLQGIELVRDRHSKEPATTEGKAITEQCLEAGLIFSVRREGFSPPLRPPASTTEDQIDRAVDILEQAIADVS